MSLERRLADTLHQADGYEPSPDLFERVERSIEEDAAHRRRVMWISAAVVAFVASIGAAGWAAVQEEPDGGLVIGAGSLEALETIGLLALVAVLGPAIRRFGRTFVDDAFGIGVGTAATFLVLLDLAYYMVFGGYVLLSTGLADVHESVRLTTGLGQAAWRIGGLLLLMGVLHSMTVVILPIVGLLYASAARRARRHMAGRSARRAHPEAVAADRIAQAMVWAVAGLAVLALVAVVLLVFAATLS